MPNPNSKPLSERLGTAAFMLVVLVLFYTASDTLLVIFGSFLAAFFLLKAGGDATERWGGEPQGLGGLSHFCRSDPGCRFFCSCR